MIKKRLRYARAVAKRQLGLAAAGTLLFATDVSLRLIGYSLTCKLLLGLSPTPKLDHNDETRARVMSAYVNTVANSRWLNSTCLRRSLAAWWILRWRGIPSEVRFGVNMDGGHAWVEHHGIVVNDYPDIAKRFRILYGQELMPESIARRI